MPFTTVDEQGFPVPVLAQVGRQEFEICVPFKYRRTDTDAWITVPENEDRRRTDLASVPGFLLWLVPRYGAHTLAALVHDQLVHGDRPEADEIFRDALGELEVPLIRRWFMWAAVSLATMVDTKGLERLRVIVWGVLVVLASLTFWQSRFAELGEWKPWSFLIFGQGWWWDLAIIAAASVIFLPRIWLGLVAGAGVWFIFVATVFVLATLLAYVVLEWLAERVWPRRGDAKKPVIMSMAEVPQRPRGCPELAGWETEPPDAAGQE